jgi:hypothetical protein
VRGKTRLREHFSRRSFEAQLGEQATNTKSTKKKTQAATTADGALQFASLRKSFGPRRRQIIGRVQLLCHPVV